MVQFAENPAGIIYAEGLNRMIKSVSGLTKNLVVSEYYKIGGGIDNMDKNSNIL